MPRRSKKGPDTFLELPDEQSSEVIIVKHGDTVLDVKDQETGIEQHYRCSRAVLRNSSEYFAVLFDPEKFSEGKAIEAKLQELYTQYDGPIPSSKLPRVTISDVGELPKAGASTKTVVTLFLKILHEPTTPWPVKRSQSINRVALLAIVADRFGAHALIAVYLRRHELDVTLLKDRKMSGPYKHELANRQRLLAGMVFGFPQWVLQCSAALIIDGPSDRTHQKLHSSDEDSKNDNDALWWRLPGGLEGIDSGVFVDYRSLAVLTMQQTRYSADVNMY